MQVCSRLAFYFQMVLSREQIFGSFSAKLGCQVFKDLQSLLAFFEELSPVLEGTPLPTPSSHKVNACYIDRYATSLIPAAFANEFVAVHTTSDKNCLLML